MSKPKRKKRLKVRIDFVTDGNLAAALAQACKTLTTTPTALARQGLLFELARLHVLPEEMRPVVEAALNRRVNV
jgi:hypothetical protein